MNEYQEYEGKRIKSGLYSMVVDIRFKTLQKKLKKLYLEYKDKLIE